MDHSGASTTTVSPVWWSEDTVAVVTGANAGIGYEIVCEFAEKGLTVVLTALEGATGQEAVDTLKARGVKNIWFHTLNITSPESVNAPAAWLKEKFGGFDILVNNAGVSTGPSRGPAGGLITSENAEWIVGTNYGGTKAVTESLLSLLRASSAGARIVNVTSRAGCYGRVKNEAVLVALRDEERYTKELADSLASKYLADVKAGKSTEEGWLPYEAQLGVPMYSESKLFLNVYAVALAKQCAEFQPADHQILVTSFCPGATQTDLLDRSRAAGIVLPEEITPQTAAAGADTGVWLALLPKEELAKKVGKFFGERTEYPFGWGTPPV